ncbi:HAD family hydrolase [Leucobacter sp. wl10]|uniref:HAD family hydrolase n=1 Tax=Leucobacter sp. wl10 TaxID=2304677 RepID=UPI000E5C4524|nr:HAD-IA family hydrolase [Leucobacter sp. wl10]RGE20502.1 HAD family hydrolase [Leucobacter sp. wl10]
MTATSIVFDLDGTLVDSSPDIAAALNTAFAPLAVRELTASEVLAMLGGGPRALVQQAIDAVGRSADRRRLDGLVEAYTAAYRAHPVDRTTFFADAADVLPQFAARGLKLGVCTNKRTDIAERVLDHLGVRDCFGSVVGSDRASRSKPDAAHLLETLAELHATPDECLYVGDTDIDAQTAAAAGVRYAHVAWGRPLADARTGLRSFSDLLSLVSTGC